LIASIWIFWGPGLEIYSRFYPVVVSNSGIKSYTHDGKHSESAWTDINYAAFDPIGSLNYITLGSRGSRKEVVIPLFLGNYSGFLGECEKYLGCKNSIYKVLSGDLKKAYWSKETGWVEEN
ncbi:hypothetical protein, partial [Candidatus Pelagadaptatus aseana]|uniref:hypothetical protein n=1 Tax=Candidatus Pelagadaptatus aseana TaxID=3120508 RepID=UPI003C6FF415